MHTLTKRQQMDLGIVKLAEEIEAFDKEISGYEDLIKIARDKKSLKYKELEKGTVIFYDAKPFVFIPEW